MDAPEKYTVLITIDDQDQVRQASGTGPDARQAAAVAWKRIEAKLKRPAGQQLPLNPTELVPPATKQGYGANSPVHPSNMHTATEADEAKCPVHELARPSKGGGLYCPSTGPGPDGKSSPKGFCTWTYGAKTRS